MEKYFDFDRVYDRRGTNSIKWDFFAERGHSEDELPLWVADMDFRSPEPVIRALEETAGAGFFGYTLAKYEDKKIVSDYLFRRHGFAPDPGDIIFLPSVCAALTMALLGLSKEGDGVMIHQPVYYPFANIVRDVGRKLVIDPLVRDENGRYIIDYVSFENKIVSEQVKFYILCSPHNPVGRVWTKDELRKIGDICLAHKVTVFADEIHADFVYEGSVFTPFASLSEDYRENCVTFTSPSKTFNMAGLQIAEAIVHDEKKRRAVLKTAAVYGLSEQPIMGLAAMKAAYSECDAWVDALVSYVYGNITFMEGFLKEKIPVLEMVHPEGTYLPWVDFGKLGLSRDKLEDLIRNRAKLWLDAGYIFGHGGEGFQRFNAACPREVLKQALERTLQAVISIPC
ncbi:MAG: pyridoxal phosphate-dependent aminotransferase [Lachnospiraceae bacterium]|nr:pyridoxal phosphate-dependent aminotransferase [Lachnospiraceae bacterium]